MATSHEPPRRHVDDTAHDAEFVEYHATHDIRLRNRLVEAHQALVRQEASRFAGRGEPIDDLVQVAQLGLLRAVQRYDPSRGVPFTAYARPTMAGELRRHFRDTTWSVRVPRSLKELRGRLGYVTSDLTQRLGRPPSATELATELGCTVDDVFVAMDLGTAYRPISLSATPDDASPLDPPADEPFAELAGAPDRVAVRQLLAELPQRERTIVYLRFFGQLSQSEIAERVGMSQVHVSRLLRSTMNAMKARLQESAESAERDEPVRPGPDSAPGSGSPPERV